MKRYKVFEVNQYLHAEDEVVSVYDLAAEEARSEMHAKINADVAKALGLPVEGEGSSWHDLGEKVAAVMDQIAEAQIREQETANRAEAAEEKAKASVALLREAKELLEVIESRVFIWAGRVNYNRTNGLDAIIARIEEATK